MDEGRGLIRFGIALGASLVLAPYGEPAAADSGLPEELERRLTERRAELVELRHDLHRHPELSGQEKRTAGVVARHLEGLGLEVRTGVGGHGVVAVLRGSRPGPVVAYRADMDAVRSTAPDPVPYRSLTPGVRHICGHDLHVTVGIALAEGLATIREELAGTVVFLFQPAEEAGTGARAMIDDGALEGPVPEAYFGVHTAPFPVGQIGVQVGPTMPFRDLVNIACRGGEASGRAVAADEMLEVLRGLDTLTPEDLRQQTLDKEFRLSRGSRNTAGAAEQVSGSVTTASRALSRDAEHTLRRLLPRSGQDGVHCQLEYRHRVIPGVTNDSDLEAAVRPSIQKVIGEAAYQVMPGVVVQFSEDFGFFQDEAPGVFYWLGVSNPEAGTVGMPHSPDYVADDAAIFVGARAMAAAILARLAVGRR